MNSYFLCCTVYSLLSYCLFFAENSLLAQSRFMLLESMQILFSLFGIICIIKSTRKSDLASVMWLFVGALSLGCCFS